MTQALMNHITPLPITLYQDGRFTHKRPSLQQNMTQTLHNYEIPQFCPVHGSLGWLVYKQTINTNATYATPRVCPGRLCCFIRMASSHTLIQAVKHLVQ